MVQVVWFKRDLRSVDHRPLAEAAAVGPLLPLYVVEPDYWAQPDCSRRQFIAQMSAVQALAERLSQLGAPLIVRQGEVVACLRLIHQHVGISRLLAHEETGNGWSFARDRAVRRFCRDTGIAFVEYPQFGVIRGLTDRDQWGRGHAAFLTAPLWPEPPQLQAIAGAVPIALPDATSLSLAEDGCVALQRLTLLRRLPDYPAEADQVFQRHGSRQRRQREDDPAKRRAESRARQGRAARQLALDL